MAEKEKAKKAAVAENKAADADATPDPAVTEPQDPQQEAPKDPPADEATDEEAQPDLEGTYTEQQLVDESGTLLGEEAFLVRTALRKADAEHFTVEEARDLVDKLKAHKVDEEE